MNRAYFFWQASRRNRTMLEKIFILSESWKGLTTLLWCSLHEKTDRYGQCFLGKNDKLPLRDIYPASLTSLWWKPLSCKSQGDFRYGQKVGDMEWEDVG